MSVVYLSPHLSGDSSGGTLVAKSNLGMLQALFGTSVIAYAASRTPMAGTVALDVSRGTVGTAWSNLRGLCATLTPTGRRQFLDEIRARQPELVWLDTSLFGGMIPEIRRYAPRARIVAYFHNAEIDLLSQRVRGGDLHYLPAWLATRSNERASAQHADAIVVITAQDGERIRELHGRADAKILPVALRPARTATRPASINSDVVLFVGSDFGPNVEGLKFLNTEVAPRLKSRRVLVAGRGLAKHLGSDVHPRVKMLGFVDDLSEIYSQALLTLAPIFSGGGMKVKIAESLMHDRAVIATPFAAIGYEQASRDSIRRATSADEFAQAIEQWAPPATHRPIDDFVAHYSFDANLARVTALIADLGVRH